MITNTITIKSLVGSVINTTSIFGPKTLEHSPEIRKLRICSVSHFRLNLESNLISHKQYKQTNISFSILLIDDVIEKLLKVTYGELEQNLIEKVLHMRLLEVSRIFFATRRNRRTGPF